MQREVCCAARVILGVVAAPTVWCVVAVPIYDSLGDNAVEYICSHAGVELIFLDVAKLSEFTRVPRCACDERNDWVPLWKA